MSTPISRRAVSPLALGVGVALSVFVALAGGVAPACAFDGTTSPEDQLPLSLFKTPKAALQAGLEGVRKGQKRAALVALQFAADAGESLAQWKLGKMYAAGDGVPHDDAKAFDYFSAIVQNYDEDQPNPREAPFVSSAFVALGVYNLNGIPNTRVTSSPNRALEMFHYAAVNFGDPSAQYNMARMFLDGNGVPRDPRQAARWLYLAAEKGHIESEAVLGQLLFNGYDGVAPQRGKGLMWLSLANDGAADRRGKQAWVADLYKRAWNAATPADRQLATDYLDGRARHRG